MNIPKSLSDLNSDENHRTVTDSEKELWNSSGNIDIKEQGVLLLDLTPLRITPGVTNSYYSNNSLLQSIIDYIYAKYDKDGTETGIICGVKDKSNYYDPILFVINVISSSYIRFSTVGSLRRENWGNFYRGMLTLNVDSNTRKLQNGQLVWTQTSLASYNRETFIPRNDYDPATKKYVDDSISTAIGNINTVLATLTTPTSNGGVE